MTLIIGGKYQGKSAYAIQLCGADATIANGAICTEQEYLNCTILDNLHLHLARLLQKKFSLAQIMQQLQALCAQNPSICIICDEVGCGIVPMSTHDRLYRETVGRICCMLAQQAQQVIRVVCGLPIPLKG